MRRRAGTDLQVARLGLDWARVIAPFAYAPTTVPELEFHLRGHVESLYDALLRQPFQPDAGYSAGVALVVLHMTKPEAIEASHIFLADRLLTDLDLDPAAHQPHLIRLLAAFAHGYARALSQRARSDQEAMFRAALLATGRSRQPG